MLLDHLEETIMHDLLSILGKVKLAIMPGFRMTSMCSIELSFIKFWDVRNLGYSARQCIETTGFYQIACIIVGQDNGLED